MSSQLPLWVQAPAAALLVLSGVFVLISAAGFVGVGEFFTRMHPPALAYTLGNWCVALAGILCFSALEARAALHPSLIIILLVMNVPVTSLLLARVTLFRRRSAGEADTPPPLGSPAGRPMHVDEAGGTS